MTINIPLRSQEDFPPRKQNKETRNIKIQREETWTEDCQISNDFHCLGAHAGRDVNGAGAFMQSVSPSCRATMICVPMSALSRAGATSRKEGHCCRGLPRFLSYQENAVSTAFVFTPDKHFSPSQSKIELYIAWRQSESRIKIRHAMQKLECA